MTRIAPALLLLALAACAPAVPPVAGRGGDAAFKARIADRHPPGASGARLRAELAGQGFLFLEDSAARRYSALDRPANVPCLSETRIDWTEDRRGRIVRIQAARHPCS